MKKYADHKGTDFLCDWIKPLYEKYPTALANVYCFAECGEGWREPIERALAVLDKHGARVAQIKNKFGGLRLYFDGPEGGGPDYQECQAAADAAEAECWKLCEECGQPGTKRANGFIQVLCDGCQERKHDV